MTESELWFLAVALLAFLAAGLAGLSLYLFRDNLRLRAIIQHIEEDKMELANKLQASLEQQAALIGVLKFVMQGEIRTARNEEREIIFAEALRKLNTIEREVIDNRGVYIRDSKVNVGSDLVGGNKPIGGDAIRGDKTTLST